MHKIVESDLDLGGLRLEVRIEAPSVTAAVQKFMNYKLWRIFELIHYACKEKPIYFITIDAYKKNLRQIMQVAKTKVFSVPDNDATSPLNRIKRFRDVLNAFGFNPGWFGYYLPILKWEHAWWHNVVVPLPPNFDNDMQALYDEFGHKLTCNKCGTKKIYCMRSSGRFRGRCANRRCMRVYPEEIFRAMLDGLNQKSIQE